MRCEARLGHRQWQETRWSVRQEHAESVNQLRGHCVVKPTKQPSAHRLAKAPVVYPEFSARFHAHSPWSEFVESLLLQTSERVEGNHARGRPGSVAPPARWLLSSGGHGGCPRG